MVGASGHPPALRASWLVRSTSPVHCMLAFAAGYGLQQAFGLPLPRGQWRELAHIAGTVLANGGLALVLWSFALFALHRTTILPGSAPTRLLLRGPFRWTRNPVYLGLLASYVGLALMLDVPWALAWLPLPVWILQRAIIPFEEANLRVRFGDEYRAYCASVPRWL